MARWTFTSESVTEGHPDKVADQVSDSILDAILEVDPAGRVACETMVTTGLCVVAGEMTTSEYVEIPKIVRKTITDIGYDDANAGFDGNTCGVIVSIDEQSADIAQGVDASEEVRSSGPSDDDLDLQGAGDQGMMFGYACDETPELMPLPIWTAHRMAERLAEVRHKGQVPYLRPDGKTQVTFEYEDGRPIGLKNVVISTQHQDGIDRDTVIRPDLIEQVINPVIPEQFASDNYDIFINPTGRFVIGGPQETAGSRAERSLSTRMEAWVATAAGPSAVRIHQRLTGLRLMRPGGLRNTSSPQVQRAVASYRLRTQLVSPTQ